MNPREGIKLTTLVIAGLTATVLSWLGLQWWISSGRMLPEPGWLGIVLIIALAGAVVLVGWPVKKLRDGKAQTYVSPLRAARTLALAQAVALTGAVLGGWYAAGALALAPDADVASVSAQVWWLVLHVVLAALLAAAGMLVQSWCRILPRDEDGDEERRPTT